MAEEMVRTTEDVEEVDVGIARMMEMLVTTGNISYD